MDPFSSGEKITIINLGIVFYRRRAIDSFKATFSLVVPTADTGTTRAPHMDMELRVTTLERAATFSIQSLSFWAERGSVL